MENEINTTEYNCTKIRGTHAYSFRTGEWAKILTVKIVMLENGEARAVFQCIYDDGTVDYIAMLDSDNYELGVF